MITPQLTLGLHEEIFVDNFAGGGGASTGIERGLGRFVDVALNHCRKALAMHRMNHPQTVHLAEDIMSANPVAIAAGRPVGGVWFSPDCKHFSKAKGGRPRSKKIRGLAWSVIHWVNTVSPRVIFLENVEEFQTWCPLDRDDNPSKWRKGWFFHCFIGALRRRGYVLEWRELRACDYGAPTIRKRFFLIARRDGQPIVWPEPTHGPLLRQKHRAVAECLDFSLPCPSIFLTREQARAVKAIRPLAPATMARIAKGVDRYILGAKRPFLVSLTHQGGDRVEPVDSPAKTITGAHRGEKALVVGVVAPAGECRGVALVHTAHGERDRAGKKRGRGSRSVDEPSLTITASNDVAVVAASIVKMRGEPRSHAPGHGLDEPIHTISAQGNHHAVAACYLAQHNGGFNTNPGHPVDEPASTISGRGSQQQLVSAFAVKYYGTDQDPRLDEPAHTVTTKDRFGLAKVLGVIPPLTPELEAAARRVAAFLREHGIEVAGEFAMVGEYVLVDIGMRMLRPRELFLAQGFPPSYIIDRGLDEDERTGRLFEIRLTGTDQVRMCGNSVCPPLAEALVAANLPDMRAERSAA